jgi:hypothetical protein
MASKLKRLTDTGDVTTRRSYLKSVVLVLGVAVQIDLRDGAAGPIVETINLGGSGQVEWHAGDPKGAGFSTGIHATFSIPAVATFEYDEIAG